LRVCNIGEAVNIEAGMSEHETIKHLSDEIEKLRAEIAALFLLRNVDNSMIHLLYGLLSVDAAAKTLLNGSVAATMKEFSARMNGENHPLAAMILAELQKFLADDVGKISMREKLHVVQGGVEAQG
jgi:hypothetical protein